MDQTSMTIDGIKAKFIQFLETIKVQYDLLLDQARKYKARNQEKTQQIALLEAHQKHLEGSMQEFRQLLETTTLANAAEQIQALVQKQQELQQAANGVAALIEK